MNTLLFTISIAVLYGVYDFFIKLSVGKINPFLGALTTQLFSALLILLFLCFNFFERKHLQFKITADTILLNAVAGLFIGLALVLLFVLFQNKEVKLASALPFILTFRTITVVLLGVFILKENVTIQKTAGFVISLIGVFLLY